jgi:AAA+ superfamily predicted ATPase
MSAQACQAELARVAGSARACSAARAVLLMARDREEALALLERVAIDKGLPLRHITAAAIRNYDAGSLAWTTEDESDRSPADMLQDAARREVHCIVLLEELLCHIKDGSQHVRARLQLADLLADPGRSAGLLLVLLEAPEAETSAPAMISAQLVKLSLGYPTARELDELCRAETSRLAAHTRARLDVAAIRSNAPAMAHGLVGLTRKAARDLIDDSLAIDAVDLAGAVRFLNEEKARRLSRELCMEVLDCEAAEVPAGVENLLQYLEIQKPRMRMHGKGRARGVLLVGPPGTGKTTLARALGHLSGLPVVVFRISAIMNSLLGATERLFSRAFATLEAMAPSIVFIDEIDKAFGRAGNENDGGTMARVTGTLLSWLSDNPHPNYVIGTTNNLARLSEAGAMTRSERFDATFFVDVPGETARAAILRAAIRSLCGPEGLRGESDTLALELTRHTRRFSGADLYSCVKHAVAVAGHAGRALSGGDIQSEIARKRARVEALYDEYAPLRHWAQVHCELAGSTDD